jgi:hypothetical protein
VSLSATIAGGRATTARRKRPARRIVVARGTERITTAKPQSLTIALTPDGRRLLGRRVRLSTTLTVAVKAPDGTTVRASRRLTILKRR